MNKPVDNTKQTALLDVLNLSSESEENSENGESAESKSVNVSLDDQLYADDVISPGKKVTLNFSLAPSNRPDALIDSNFNKAPVSFDFGDGNLLASFEEAMIGLKAGDKKSITVDAKSAFGLRNEDNIHCYPRYQFPADLVLEKGLMINFSDAAGNEQAGVVSTFTADEVWVDFNHPLADVDILFTVDIKAVEPIE